MSSSKRQHMHRAAGVCFIKHCFGIYQHMHTLCILLSDYEIRTDAHCLFYRACRPCKMYQPFGFGSHFPCILNACQDSCLMHFKTHTTQYQLVACKALLCDAKALLIHVQPINACMISRWTLSVLDRCTPALLDRRE